MPSLKGGSATPVYVISDADLQQNGGRWKIQGGSAVPMYNASPTASPESTITVAKSGGDYTTIEDALNAASGRTCIVVYPGIYQENNPLVGKANVTIRSCGEQNTTRIEALNANQDLFTSANFFIVDGLSLANVSGTGWVMNITANHSVIFEDCVIFQCEQAFRINNSSATLTLRDIFYLSISGVTLACAIRNNAGNVTISGGRIGENSTVTNVFDMDGANAITTIQDFLSFESTVTTIFQSDNGARSVVNGCSFVAMNDGFVCQGGSNTQVVATVIFNAQQDGLRIPNVGAGTQFTAQGLTIDGSTRFDANILSASAIVSGYGISSLDKMNFATGAQFTAMFIDLKEDDEGTNILGELHVGTPEAGTESVMGGGDSYTRGMLVYTYNPAGAVWTDVSTAARSASGSTFTFPAVAQDNAIYMASSLVNGGDFLQHFGIKASITTAVVLGGGSLVVEYWTGAAWTAINHMSTLSDSPYTQQADHLFERTGSEQIRYPSAFLSGWTKNDPMTIGTDYYWIRFRVASAVTTVPIFQQYKLHTNRFEVNADGATEYFGAGRYQKDLIVHIALNDPVTGSAPSNSAIAFSSTITLTIERNQFNNNSVDAFGEILTIPEGLDTSIPLTLETIWYPDTNNAGDVELDAIFAQLEVGDLWNGTKAETTTSVVETVPANDQFVTRKTTHSIDVSALVPGELLVFKVQRDATVGNDPPDTLAGNIKFGSVRMFGTFWRP